MNEVIAPSTLMWNDAGDTFVQASAGFPPLRISTDTVQVLQAARAGGATDLQSLSPQTRQDLIESGVLTIARHGFSSSKYHEATRDYPFLDMSGGVDSLIEDAARMATYLRADDAPPSAFLDYEDFVAPFIALPRIADFSVDELAHRAEMRLPLVVVGAFGVRRVQVPYFDAVTDYFQMELLRKAVPSGGARHPAECFLEVRASDAIPTGFYHFSTRRNGLVRLPVEAPRLDVPATAEFPPASTDILVHMAMAVGRDMFRYRDPRSFRAVLVDAGHVDGQLAALAGYVNLRYESSPAFSLNFGEHVNAPGGVPLPRFVVGRIRGWS